MSFTMVSVLKEQKNAGRPIGFKDRVIFFKWDDVATMPERDENGVAISGDILLNPGSTAIEMYVTPETLKVYDTSEGDPDKKGFLQHLEFEHPGDELGYAEFAENAINENFGAIVRTCEGTRSRLLGTPCCPLQFQHEGQNDNEANTNMVTFASLRRGPKIAHYNGAIPELDSDASGSGV